jgi:hypothetical protein
MESYCAAYKQVRTDSIKGNLDLQRLCLKKKEQVYLTHYDILSE